METRVQYTGDDLLRLPTSERVELLRGELVPMPPPPGGRHGGVTLQVGLVLKSHVNEHGLGKVLVECGFFLARNPDTVRGPDVAFYADLSEVPEGYLEVIPDLAVEVVSPSQSSADLQERVQEFLTAGVREVWALYPRTKTVHRFYPGGKAQVLCAQDVLCGDPLLPGFSCQVTQLFSV